MPTGEASQFFAGIRSHLSQKRIYSAPNRSGQVDRKTTRVIAGRICREKAIMSAQINKIALFIDGPNLYTTARSLGFEIDFKRLLREFQSRGYLLRAFYYTAVIEDSSIRPLIDWLDYNGYTVVTKATKEFVDATETSAVKGDDWISNSQWTPSSSRRISIRWCYFPGTAISVAWSRQCNGAACASSSSQLTRRSRRWSLRSCVADLDEFIDIKALQSKIARDPDKYGRRSLRSHRNSSRTASPQNETGEEFDEV